MNEKSSEEKGAKPKVEPKAAHGAESEPKARHGTNGDKAGARSVLEFGMRVCRPISEGHGSRAEAVETVKAELLRGGYTRTLVVTVEVLAEALRAVSTAPAPIEVGEPTP